MTPLQQRIVAVVARIPRGRVASYGLVAWLAGAPRCARQVGRALRELPEDAPLPWHRVVNARGELSLSGDGATEQRRRLLREGVRFDARGRIDLVRWGWDGRASRKRTRARA
ncbi:MAG: MGMT family protein [Nannocystaceae bacterium]